MHSGMSARFHILRIEAAISVLGEKKKKFREGEELNNHKMSVHTQGGHKVRTKMFQTC